MDSSAKMIDYRNAQRFYLRAGVRPAGVSYARGAYGTKGKIQRLVTPTGARYHFTDFLFIQGAPPIFNGYCAGLSIQGIIRDGTVKLRTLFLKGVNMKKRRESSRCYIRIQSRKHRPTVIKKTIYVTALTIFFILLHFLYTAKAESLSLLWAILVVAVVIPDKEKTVAKEDTHRLRTDKDEAFKNRTNPEGLRSKIQGNEKVTV